MLSVASCLCCLLFKTLAVPADSVVIRAGCNALPHSPRGETGSCNWRSSFHVDKLIAGKQHPREPLPCPQAAFVGIGELASPLGLQATDEIGRAGRFLLARRTRQCLEVGQSHA